jgi:hypothetical protein
MLPQSDGFYVYTFKWKFGDHRKQREKCRLDQKVFKHYHYVDIGGQQRYQNITALHVLALVMLSEG